MLCALQHCIQIAASSRSETKAADPKLCKRARCQHAMEAAKHDKTTVFVRGVAFSTGPEDFEAHFSELGPVRTSFLVKDKGKTGHKGFGFVQYALPEDAQKAAEQLHNTEFQGRKLKVSPAHHHVVLHQWASLVTAAVLALVCCCR